MANIKGQITYALNQCFEEGVDKHSIKREIGFDKTERIYSRNVYFHAKDTAKDMQVFLRENYPSVKEVRQIKPEMLQEFLNSKTDHCTQKTVNEYANRLDTIQRACEKTFRIDLNWKQEIVVPKAYAEKLNTRGVNDVMTREDYNKIKEYCLNNLSKDSNAIIAISGTLGNRVKALCNIKIEKIDFEKNTVDIKDKGNKWITREMTQEVREILENRVNKLSEKGITQGNVFNIKSDSVNKQITRIEQRLGLDDTKSMHSIRRMVAQEKFDSYREQGLDIRTATDKVSEWLSHGKNRDAMLKECYIKLR